MSGQAPQKTLEILMLENIQQGIGRIEAEQSAQRGIQQRLVGENIVIRSNYRSLKSTVDGIGKLVGKHEKTINIAFGGSVVAGAVAGFIVRNWDKLLDKLRS